LSVVLCVNNAGLQPLAVNLVWL